MSKASIPDLQKAYATLGVGFAATALEIERAYRERLSRASGADSREALNGAYLLVAGAPLRAFATAEKPISNFQGGALVGVDLEDDRPGSPDAFGYAIRFVCGALLGALVSARMWFRYYLHPGWYARWEMVTFSSLIVIGFGLAAAVWGDSFWYSTLGDRWFWWRNR